MENNMNTIDKVQELSENLRNDLTEIEKVATTYTLADAIREGCTVTDKATSDWGQGDTACALHSAVIAAAARGYIKL